MSIPQHTQWIAQRLKEFEHSAYSEPPLFAHSRAPRLAAVLIPLIWDGQEWHLLFTRRSDGVEHHKGQVSFPGGAAEAQDASPEHTALREAEEEIGIRPEDVQIVGRLGQMLTITNFDVTPVVGILPWPYIFKVHTREVGRVFTIPLNWLADSANYHEFIRAETGRSLIAYYPFDGELLWGATARMTLNFLLALGLVK